MAFNFLPCDRDQPYLLPPSLKDWLPEDHLAWFLLDVVDEMDLRPFYAVHREDGWGAPAFEPKMMLTLWGAFIRITRFTCPFGRSMVESRVWPHGLSGVPDALARCLLQVWT